MQSPHEPKAVYSYSLVFLLFLMLAESSLAETFSIVVLPDTQFYSQDDPAIFTAQTNWIRANEGPADENIIYVAHLGDIVDSFGCNAGATEWGNADTSMDVLDGVAGPADDIPYGVLPGNHDFDTTTPGGPVCATTRNNYNANFGPSRYGTYYGGNEFSSATNNDNNFTLFSSPGGIDFIAINLAYSGAAGPVELATLAWAEGLLQANPDRIGIVTSHSILSDSRTGGVDCERTDPFTEYGSLIWDELGDNPNLNLVLSGHCRGERWISYQGGSADRPGCLGDTHVLMSNYQGFNGNQSGYLRIMRFDTVLRTIEVETFSPTLPGGGTATAIGGPGAMNNNSASNFSLDYNLFVAKCADVALAIDRSGSMNAASAAIAGTKLDAVKLAADLFVDQIALDGDHRLAMVQFNSAVVPFAVPEVPFTPLNTGNSGPAHTMVGSIVGGGATNIIDGLEGGVDKLDVGSPNERRVAVLFTDGRHNTPSTLSDADLQTALSTEINAVDADMELYSLGFGTSISNAPLSGAANANGGWHVTEVDPIVVAKGFSLIAARVMDDQVLTDPVYVIKPGETRAHGIGVSRADTNLTIAVHWDQFDPNRVKTNVVPPGGAACPIKSGATVSGVQQTSGTNYRLVRVDLPFPCSGTSVHEGDWQVEMTVSGERREPERVDVLAYASTPIKMNAKVELTAGQLNIEAFLEGAPFKDATFTAYILPPLPETRDSTSLDDIGSTPDGAASIPPLALIPRNAIAIPLTESGRTEESIRAKGIANPKKKGLYEVRVVADVIDGLTGQMVNREAMASFYSPKAKSTWPPKWVLVLVIFVLIAIFYWVWRRKKL